MKFGYYILNTYVPDLDGESSELYAHWLEQIDAAEDLGFDSLWVTEHHFRYFGGMLPNPQLLLAAAAQRTKRMRLGAAVTILPMHHPIRIAEDFAMVDLLSNGRLNFGAGRGMHPLEYTVFDADFKTAQSRLPEALDIIVRAWTGGEFEWNGKHYRYPKLAVYPKPAQKPHPPVILGGHARTVLERIVEWGDGWLPNRATPAEIEAGRKKLDDLARKAGRNPSAITISVFAHSSFITRIASRVCVQR